MKKLSLLLLFSILISFVLQAQNSNESPRDTILDQSLLEPVSDTLSNINIFGEDKPLNIKLIYDITDFMKTKKEGKYIDAVFQIHNSDEVIITKNIRLKARGNFRRGQCMFPPIYLNFKTDPFENNELEGIKKVKLVTHCSSSKSSEDYILKEYLAYKMYNVLSPYGFRVRLCKIQYIDTGKKERNYETFGFFIEPEELLMSRTQSVEIDSKLMSEQNVIEKDADRVALFQYMIGNTDWRFKGGHNTKCVKSLQEVTSKIIPVPYDFDFSGFVHTGYSFPQSWTNIEKVTDREYTGYCRNSDEEYLNNINFFLDKKGEVLSTIENDTYLDEKAKKSALIFIDGFYSEISDTDKFIRKLKKQCRNDASMRQDQ